MIITIDGVAGAGKSTLARFLHDEFQSKCSVFIVHMDFLYDGWKNPFSPALSEKLTAIVQAHIHSLPSSISFYDWQNSAPGPISTIPAVQTLIIEGVGSGQRAIREFVDTKIWIDLETMMGLRRVLQRDGGEIEDQMLIFLEEQRRHFVEEGTRDAADFHLNGLY